jgi:hypothetical protein
MAASCRQARKNAIMYVITPTHLRQGLPRRSRAGIFRHLAFALSLRGANRALPIRYSDNRFLLKYSQSSMELRHVTLSARFLLQRRTWRFRIAPGVDRSSLKESGEFIRYEVS